MTNYTIQLWYTDDTTQIKSFKTKEEADWYARTSGDHVRDWKVLQNLSKDEEKNT